jgi:uncharacterized RDD family membrane protein YckC
MMPPAPGKTAEFLLPQSVFPRGVAYVIDTIVVAVLTATLMAAGVLKNGGLESLDPNAIRDMLQSNAGLTVYVILFAYFLVCEGASGRTVGKLALGLRVVRVADGRPCGWGRSIIRNLIRPLDLFFVGLPGGLVVMLTPARQRIGDLFGGTLVVRQMTIPAAMAAVIPGMLRRCSSCGRLAPAAGPCPGCSAPPPPSVAPTAPPIGAAFLQPLAGMMAAGEAAAALRASAQAVLAAETAFGAASAAESARLGSESAAAEPEAPGVAATEADDAFVATDGAHGLADEYVAAWRRLMSAVETLRSRRGEFDAALATARLPLAQATATDPLLGELLDEVEPYLDADDDEAVLAAFMVRSSAAGGGGQPAS